MSQRRKQIVPFLVLWLLAIKVSSNPFSIKDTNGSSLPNPGTTESEDGNCSKPSIEKFPRPMMPQNARIHGGLVVHVLVTLYMFLGLAIVCDDYFLPSLEILADVLKLQKDVAGATLMAAGSSAPELATSMIGVFLVKDDIGLGAVVGSAVFNVAFVVSICGLFSGRVIFLSAWPLLRDSLFYLLSIAALMAVIANQEVTWVESLLLLLLYVVYIGAMCYNIQAEKWFYNKFPSFQPHIPLLGEDYKETNRGEEEVEEEEKGVCRRFLELISKPILWVLAVTCPDCRDPAWQHWYPITFLMSCVWIGLMTYLLVWMITIIGFTLSISDTVMALSLLAAGVSVPDAIASYLVVKKGMGDMAISNAVGSNVFDILLCMGLPWFLQTAAITPGKPVLVQSEGLTYSTIALFSTVLFLVLATHFNGWKLDQRHGCLMMFCYLAFMAFSLITELATTTAPTCHSDY